MAPAAAFFLSGDEACSRPYRPPPWRPFLVPAAAAARTSADDGSRIIFESRLRSGSVDQAGAAREGHALTLRTRLDWRSPTMAELQLLITRFEGERTGFPDAVKLWLSLDYRY